MTIALISTVYNEGSSIESWFRKIQAQTIQPDEISIVDGGSTDGTWERLQDLAAQSSVPVRLKQQRCNIAEGRNLAIQMTNAEIIVSIDGGSLPESNWLKEIASPLLKEPLLDVVGGRCILIGDNPFQKYALQFEGTAPEAICPDEVYPSSRNIAFRREAWSDVGGYPEWLTLTGEDALFNMNLHKIDKMFLYNGSACIDWEIRGDVKSFFKMLYLYGYGAAEARIFTAHFLRCTILTLFPFLLLMSKYRYRDFLFRYRKNFSGSTGWLMGLMCGRRAPKNWKRVGGVLLSPEAELHFKSKNIS